MYGSSTGSETSYSGGLKKAYADATAAKVSTSGRPQFEADFNNWATSGDNDTGKTNLAEFTYEEFTTKFVPEPDNQIYYEKVAAEKRAKEAYEAELTKLIGGTDPSAAATASSLQGRLDAANTALGDASSGATQTKNAAQTRKDTADADVASKQGIYDSALSAYESALAASGGDTSDLETAKANRAAALAAMNAAQAAYDKANAATPSDGILKVNIYLSDDVVTSGGVADKWQLSPNPISGDVAKFYYTSILDGGETSSKLVDRVELDGSATQDMYKSFDFDVNVALKSAQITYAEDNETILGTAATSELNKTPTLTDPKDINTALTWN